MLRLQRRLKVKLKQYDLILRRFSIVPELDGGGGGGGGGRKKRNVKLWLFLVKND